jgi:hypothetical protein
VMTPPWRSRLAWLVGTASAALLFIGAVLAWRIGNQPVSRTSELVAQAQLLFAWAQLLVASALAWITWSYVAQTRRLVDHTVAERTGENERRKLEAAARVNAWFQVMPGSGSDGSGRLWEMVVENSGHETIYEWEAAVWWAWLGQGGAVIQAHSMSSANQGSLYPGARFTEVLAWSGPAGQDFATIDHTQRMRVAITWRDPRGDSWWIRYQGRLEESTDRRPLPWTVSPAPAGLPDLDELARRALGWNAEDVGRTTDASRPHDG